MTAPKIRTAVASLPGYKPGQAPTAGPDGRSWKLSSNEVHFDPLPGVLAAAEQALREMNRYPDMFATQLSETVAAFWSDQGHPIGTDQLAFGTGSSAILYDLLRLVATAGDEVVYPWRSFEAYPIAVMASGATPVPIPVRADGRHDLAGMLAAITERTRAVLVCTPNNPTGPALTATELRDFLDAIDPSVLLVLDEAYLEFATDPDVGRGEDFLDRPNVVVMRTFSKAYGLAGLRVGYAISTPEIAGSLRKIAVPFGVPQVAQAAAIASFAAVDELRQRVREVTIERDRLLAGLREIGWEVPDSQANFVWLDTGARTAEVAAPFIADGLMVRAFTNGDPFDGIRISVADAEATDRVLAIAAQVRR
ncbi:histidinol-phosphate transaminase [Granulicoccus phenolivorans]|uniref:histidinol-phosphate transaminase n=1 Tax=Granulicoccus phenolivorans TaxID=266854 RepID=UPI00040EE50A|nr:histidinol-phosphate transaminase [Granulicoccus phenolivorans]